MMEENSALGEKEPNPFQPKYGAVLHSTPADATPSTSGQPFMASISSVMASSATQSRLRHLESLSSSESDGESNFPTLHKFVTSSTTTLHKFVTSSTTTLPKSDLSSRQFPTLRYEINERYEPMGSENTDEVANPLPLLQASIPSSQTLPFFPARSSQLAARPPLIGQSDCPPVAPPTKEEDSGGSSGSSSDTLSRRVKKMLEEDTPSLSPHPEELLIDLSTEVESSAHVSVPPPSSDYQVARKHSEDTARLAPDHAAEGPDTEESSSFQTHSDQRIGSPTSVSSKLEWDSAGDIGYRFLAALQAPAQTPLLNRSEPEGGSIQAPGPQRVQDACVQTDALLMDQRDAEAQTSFSKQNYGSSSSMGSTSSQSTIKVAAPAAKKPVGSADPAPAFQSIRLPSTFGQMGQSKSTSLSNIPADRGSERMAASKSPFPSYSSDSRSDSPPDKIIRQPELRDTPHLYGREPPISALDLGAGHTKFTQTNISFLAQRHSQIPLAARKSSRTDDLLGLSSELRSLAIQPPRVGATSSSSFPQQAIAGDSLPSSSGSDQTSHGELLKQFDMRNRFLNLNGVTRNALGGPHSSTSQDDAHSIRSSKDIRNTIPKEADTGTTSFYLSTPRVGIPKLPVSSKDKVSVSSLPPHGTLSEVLGRGLVNPPPLLGIYPENQPEPILGPDKPTRHYSTFRPYYIVNKASQQERPAEANGHLPPAVPTAEPARQPSTQSPHQQARQEFEKLQKWVRRQRKFYLSHLMRDIKHFNRIHSLATRSTRMPPLPRKAPSSYPSGTSFSDSSRTSLEKYPISPALPLSKLRPSSRSNRSEVESSITSSSNHPSTRKKENLPLKEFGQTFPTPSPSSSEVKIRNGGRKEQRHKKKFSVGVQARPLEEIQNVPDREMRHSTPGSSAISCRLSLAWEIPQPDLPKPTASLTLQSAFQQKCRDLITRSKQRALYVRALEQQRMIGQPADQENWAPPPAPPSGNGKAPAPRRIISEADMRARTERRYRTLAEVAQRKEIFQRKNEYKNYRQAASAFVKKLQWNALHGRVTFGLAPIHGGHR